MSNIIDEDARVIGQAVGLTPQHAARVTAEIAAWVDTGGAQTWACEAAGVRLRPRSQLAYDFATVDFRGRLLAAHPSERGKLVSAMAKIVRDYGKPTYVGLRGIVKLSKAALVRTTLAGLEVLETFVPRDRKEVIDRLAHPTEKWHLPLAMSRTAEINQHDGYSVLCYHPVGVITPCELRVGPVSIVLNEPDTAHLLAVMKPDATESQVNALVVQTMTARWFSWALENVTRVKRVRVDVARFAWA